jgi:hypothetical protein
MRNFVRRASQSTPKRRKSMKFRGCQLPSPRNLRCVSLHSPANRPATNAIGHFVTKGEAIAGNRGDALLADGRLTARHLRAIARI